MTELELFESYCKTQIALNELKLEQMLLSNEPKWVIAKFKSSNNTYECMESLKALKQFKQIYK